MKVYSRDDNPVSSALSYFLISLSLWKVILRFLRGFCGELCLSLTGAIFSYLNFYLVAVTKFGICLFIFLVYLYSTVACFLEIRNENKSYSSFHSPLQHSPAACGFPSFFHCPNTKFQILLIKHKISELDLLISLTKN